MKQTQEPLIVTHYQSEVRPDIETTDDRLAAVIQWADDNPVVWKIVTQKKSKAFGLGSCVYIGWAQRSMTADAVLERVRYMMDLVRWDKHDIFTWRARFTLAHYTDKGFTGGFFQQHDCKYPRSCLTLDYAPTTQREVLAHFIEWMDKYYETDNITIDGKVVWRKETA